MSRGSRACAVRGSLLYPVALIAIAGACDRTKPTPPPSDPAAHAAAPADAARAAAAPADAGPPAPARPRDPIASHVGVAYAPGETLPEPLRKKIRAALKDRSRSPIALHHVIDIPRPDGGREVFGLYEYAAYEDCVARYPDRKTGRDHCAGHFERVFDGAVTTGGKDEVRYRKAPINRDCLALGAVHAVLGPPGSAPDGGSLSITATDLPDLRCHPVAYQRVLAADVDGDHQLELYIDVTTMDDTVGNFRDFGLQSIPALWSDWERRLFILSGADVNDTELAVQIGRVSGHGEVVPEELVDLRDVDADGHLDVIITDMSYCHVNASGWLGEPCELDNRQHVVYRYDASPGKDAYKEGIPLFKLDETLEQERRDKAEAAAAATEPAAPAPSAPENPGTAAEGNAAAHPDEGSGKPTDPAAGKAVSGEPVAAPSPDKPAADKTAPDEPASAPAGKGAAGEPAVAPSADKPAAAHP